jgi:hypothetical protein
MTQFGKYFGALLAMGLLLVALPGCEKHEGPAERAGKDIDQAVENTGQKVENLGDRIQDAAKGKPVNGDTK